MDERRTVFVVMSNDFPDSVWASEPAAKAFCAAKNAENAQRVKDGNGRIYWRVYDFEIRK